MLKHPVHKKLLKWFLITGGLLLAVGVLAYLYFFSLTFRDTASITPEFTVEALPFIREFEQDLIAANKKYAEKIILVKGTVTATEAADTTINIKMQDPGSGSYLIFAFQQQHLDKAKTLQPGDQATIKGSCSDGVYSKILGAYFISFKRCTLGK